jgi:exopolyphosphatase/guanosine-5'-triphosphate,3'-diphosphate pyrophosphatase
MTQRVAAVDCGTNSIRLLIADIGARIGASGLRDVVRRMEIVRLGQDVDRTGQLAPVAIERTRQALVSYGEQISELGVQAVRMVATSATRDAANREDFRQMVLATLGVEPEVVSGDDEAALSFAGALSGLPGAVPPVLVADIGGGSTEVVLGSARGVEAALSVDIGCVRLTERHLTDDPPTPDQIGAAEADIRAAIERIEQVVPVAEARTFVGLAGSVTTVAALAMELPAYDADTIHGSRIPVGRVRSVTSGLLTMSRERRASLPVMHPGRVDVIGGGALILRVLMDAWEIDEVTVSEHDILDGIALGLAAR